MKGRDGKSAPSADLLVCFPSRAHLALMPKPICSPARPSEPNKRHPTHHRKKSISRLGGGVASASPLYKNKQLGNEIAEPTSPRITCAGQIKVGPKTSSCKNWQSVMEEIERIHHSRKNKKKPGWIESLGFKKEVMQFLTCLRSIRLDLRCFGAFPQTDIVSDDEDEDEEEEEEEEDERNSHTQIANGDEESKTVFSNWFMVLQENQNEQKIEKETRDRDSRDFEQPAIPPPNALLLMRCRSAPAKSWLENKENEAEEEAEEDDEEKEELGDKKENRKNLRTLMDEEKVNKKIDDEDNEARLVVMRYDTDFYKISSDIAKETWLVGGTQDLFSRSRSWKR